MNRAYLYAILAVLIWSTVASAFKISLRYLNFIQLVFYASLTSMLIFMFIILVQGKFRLLLSCSIWEILYSMLLGFINPFLYYLVLFRAYSLLPAQEAQPLNYTWPIMLTLLSIPLLKQKIRLRQICAVFISFMGVWIISSHGRLNFIRFSNVFGVFLALCSALIWALYWIFSLRDERDNVVKLFLNFLFGFLYVACIVFPSMQMVFVDFIGLICAVYVGLFEMGITFMVWLKALMLAENTAKVSNLIYLTPFISLILINILVGEEILATTIFGLILIIGGILVQRS